MSKRETSTKDEPMDEPQAKRGRRGPAEELEGNQQLNKSIKEQQKKDKKRKLKAEKKVDTVADVLENFTFGKTSDEAYDFDNDFVM